MKKRLITAIALIICALCVLCLGACKSEEEDAVAYLDVQLTYEYYGFGVNKKRTDILAAANLLIDDIVNDGTFGRIYAAEEDGTATDIGEVATQSTDRSRELVVVTQPGYAPFEYKKNGNFAGIDMQIAKLLARKMGKKLVILEISFDEIISYVRNGYADIAMSAITVSEERAKLVDFTKIYYRTTQIIAFRAGDNDFKDCKTNEQVVSVIRSLDRTASAGAVAWQTGYYYIKGSQDFGFEGYPNITPVAYKSLPNALDALINGTIKFVIGDRDPVIAGVRNANG